MNTASPAGPVSESTFRVRYAETDAMGIVHHSAYIIWFEAARVAWMDAQGLPYADFAAAGNHFAVTGIDVAYRQSCRFGDVGVTHPTLHCQQRQNPFVRAFHIPTVVITKRKRRLLSETWRILS